MSLPSAPAALALTGKPRRCRASRIRQGHKPCVRGPLGVRRDLLAALSDERHGDPRKVTGCSPRSPLHAAGSCTSENARASGNSYLHGHRRVSGRRRQIKPVRGPLGAAESARTIPPSILNDPIASTSGAAICSLSGGSDTQGCIAIFTSTRGDDPPERIVKR
jgi:hypothetical protein